MAMATLSRRYSSACITRLMEITAARGGAVRSAKAVREFVASKQGSHGIRELPRGWSRPAGAGRLLPVLPQAQQMSCCAGVDAPRAPEIIVEYDEGQEDNNDFFIRLADDIEDRFPELSVLGNPDELEPRTGSFEVSRDGQVLFSMLQAKRRPTLEELIKAIENLVPRCEITQDSGSEASG